VARAALGGWHVRWERLALGVWALRTDDVAVYGADIKAGLQKLPPVIRECYADAGVDVEVEVAE